MTVSSKITVFYVRSWQNNKYTRAYLCAIEHEPRKKEHCYLPDPLQGLRERALGSALELLKPLSTATLLLRLHWGRSSLLTHLHTHGERKQDSEWERVVLTSVVLHLCLCKWKGQQLLFISLVNYSVIDLLRLWRKCRTYLEQRQNKKQRERAGTIVYMCA